MRQPTREFLKCDTPTCDFFEMTPVIIEHVGKPCPKCGANLLTEQDFVTFKALSAASRAATEIILAANPNAPVVMMATHIHGNTVQQKIVENYDCDPFPNQERT